MDDLIYLDNAATAWPKPDNVYQHMVEFYRKCGVNPGRSGYDLAVEAGNILEDLRKRLTSFFGGDGDAPERLCFGYNATDALNLIIFGVLSPGDHVITT
ncbi:MAG TPA: cysteine desulfurase, partial [candidate division Zixibacteria bacterium]|nr:cysteine desulfurase [candidate division Zixibacteria bacterium]